MVKAHQMLLLSVFPAIVLGSCSDPTDTPDARPDGDPDRVEPDADRGADAAQDVDAPLPDATSDAERDADFPDPDSTVSDADAIDSADTFEDADQGLEPECTTDEQCNGQQRCYRGFCRHDCTFGSCLLAPGGGFCREGHCVECLDANHCSGSRYTCDQQTYACVPTAIDPPTTQIGIFYNTWHCTVSEENPHSRGVYDISEILAGRQGWGPEGEFHWWDEPQAGYYCLTTNDQVLTDHAELLRDAGIDFIFVDVTNHAYVGSGSDRTSQMILEPFDRLLLVWSTILGAPQVVPWVPLPEAGTDPSRYTVDALLSRLGRYPGMHFEYLGRPLVLVTENSLHVTNEAKFAALSDQYTLRRMWVATEPSPMWSFMQACEQSPTEDALCDQRSAVLGGEIEQVAIAAAYQATYMSLPSATPKHQGLTFRRQFETLLRNPHAPIATITGWNEWIAQRQPCDSHPTCPCGTYPAGCFIDQWDMERSRDIEAAQNEMGDYYYRLMAECISLFRSGRVCSSATAGNLCCRDYQAL